MSFRLVCGRSGSGKSSFCFNEIETFIRNEKKIFIITPEQFSFTAEKKLMDAVKSKAVIGAEVLTFERMAYRVINETGGKDKSNLSASGKSMLIYDILDNKKKSLKFLGKSEENISLIGKTITEFKKHKITDTYIGEKIKVIDDNYLKSKLSDIYTIYQDFEDRITDTYIDENDTLTILSEKLDDTDMFKNSLIYIDEFAGFTVQEYEIIKKLMIVSDMVTVTICLDEMNEYSNSDVDIFYANKVTASSLFKMSKENKIKIEKSIILDKSKRFKNNELAFLEENMYNISNEKYDKEPQNIQLFLSNNPFSEIEEVAEEIVKLVKNSNFRYRDICVITKNLETYSSLTKAIFNKYEIPVFIDEKKKLSQNILAEYIITILEIFSKGWSYETVFNYLKTGFMEIEKEEIFKLENYCTKWGIKGNKWYKKDWDFGNFDENMIEQIKRFNEIRKEIVNPLINLKEKMQEAKNTEETTGFLYQFLIEMQIDKKLSKKIELLEESGLIDVANEYNISFSVVIQVLDEIVLLFKKQKLSFERYSKILKTGFNNSSLGKIPGTQDQVVLGDVDRSRSHKVKAIFIIGLNDGFFPSVHKEEGFLNDRDRETLKTYDMELAKGTLEQLYDDNFNIYKAFTTAEELLYLSYSSSDIQGTSLRASILISKIKKIFPKLKEKSDITKKERGVFNKNTTFDALIEKLRDLCDGKQIEDIWYDVYDYYKKDEIWKDKLERSLLGLSYTNIPQKIDGSLILKLYGKTLKTSISKLEKYSSCPFSFYLKYGLKLSEKEGFKLKAIDTGSFTHEIIDEFFTMIRQNGLKVQDITQEEISRIANDIIENKLNLGKNYIFTSTPKFKVLTNRLKKVILLSLNYIIDGLKNTDFEVTGNEIEFKNGSDYKPIKLDLEDGKSVEITGKIDRVDMAKNADGKYIRIIDYKSSIKNIDLNEVVAGIQIQLLTYLDATCKIEEVMPAGVLYFSFIDQIIKSNKPMTDSEIEERIRKEFRMNGLILADINVVKMMDKKLENGSSDLIPAYIDKDGNLSARKV